MIIIAYTLKIAGLDNPRSQIANIQKKVKLNPKSETKSTLLGAPHYKD